MIGLEFRETMAGSYHLASTPDEERPMSFTIRARSSGLAGFIRRPVAEIEGEVDAEGLADHRHLKGRLEMDLLRTGMLVYDFRFTDNAGQGCAFEGRKTVRLDDLLETMTVLPGRIVRGDEEIGEALLRFDLRSDLLRFLKSFRLVR